MCEFDDDDKNGVAIAAAPGPLVWVVVSSFICSYHLKFMSILKSFELNRRLNLCCFNLVNHL